MIDHPTALFFVGVYAFLSLINDMGMLISRDLRIRYWFFLAFDSVLMAWAFVSLGAVLA